MERIRHGKTIISDSTVDPLLTLPGVYKSQFSELFTETLGSQGEYRFWDPCRCELSSALHAGLPDSKIVRNSKVLCVGPNIENSVCHLSDIVGDHGQVYALELSPEITTLPLDSSKQRKNVVFLKKVEKPSNPIVDVIYFKHHSLAPSSITDRLFSLAQMFLKPEGFIMLPINTWSNNRSARSICMDIEELLQGKQFKIKAKVELPNFKEQIFLVAHFTSESMEERTDLVDRPILSCNPYVPELNHNPRETYDQQRDDKDDKFRLERVPYKVPRPKPKPKRK